MTRRLATILLCALIGLVPGAASADEDDSANVSQDTTATDWDRSFVLGIGSTGIGFGNTRRLNGIRINVRDRRVERVNGVNLTLWKARRNPHLVINGVALGLVGPEAAKIQGIGIGPMVSLEGDGLRGVGVGLLAVASDGGDLSGIAIGGLAVASDGGNLTGVNLAGLAVATDNGNLRGISVAGIAIASDNGNVSGINAAGMVIASDNGNITGLNAAGIAIASDNGSVRGINFSGLVVATDSGDIFGVNTAGLVIATDGGDIRGLSIAGGIIATDGGSITGLAIGGGGVLTESGPITGMAVGGSLLPFAITGKWIGNGWKQNVNRALIGAGLVALGGSVYSPEIKGLSLGIVNGFWHKGFEEFRITRQLTGLSIGLVNLTKNLKGFQIGLLNYAGNNPAPFKLLPLLNLNLR